MHQNMWQIGRLIYSIPLFLTGLIYLFMPKEAVETLTSFIPGEHYLMYVAGGFWVIFSLMLVFNFWAHVALWGIVGVIIAFLIMVHIPAAYNGEHLAVVWFELLKDVSLMGGAFLLLAHEKKTAWSFGSKQSSIN